MRRGVPIVSKMESLRSEIASERGGDSPLFHHVAVNLNEFRTSGDADDAYFEVAKAAIEEVGVNVFGGCLIHHPFSGSQEDDDDRDLWKERLFSGIDWSDMVDDLEENHHIHVLVLADSIDYLSCEALQDRTGVFVHRIENNDEDTAVSIYGAEDLADAATYALSHARLIDSADAYRYFGRVANHSADFQIEARCKEVVRSVVPKTLDLQPADLVCGRVLDPDQYDFAPNVSQFTFDGPDGNDENTADDEQDVEDGEVECEDKCEDNNGSDDSTNESSESGEQVDTSDDNDSETSNETDSGNSSTDSVKDEAEPGEVRCNGRLVPMEYAPSWLDDDDREIEYAEELREAYENWDPPDQRDIESFGDEDAR